MMKKTTLRSLPPSNAIQGHDVAEASIGLRVCAGQRSDHPLLAAALTAFYDVGNTLAIFRRSANPELSNDARLIWASLAPLECALEGELLIDSGSRLARRRAASARYRDPAGGSSHDGGDPATIEITPSRRSRSWRCSIWARLWKRCTTATAVRTRTAMCVTSPRWEPTWCRFLRRTWTQRSLLQRPFSAAAGSNGVRPNFSGCWNSSKPLTARNSAAASKDEPPAPCSRPAP